MLCCEFSYETASSNSSRNSKRTTDTRLTEAPLSGQLKAEYDADFIALSESSLDDIGVMGKPEKVLHVRKGEKMYMADRKPVGILE